VEWPVLRRIIPTVPLGTQTVARSKPRATRRIDKARNDEALRSFPTKKRVVGAGGKQGRVGEAVDQEEPQTERRGGEEERKAQKSY